MMNDLEMPTIMHEVSTFCQSAVATIQTEVAALQALIPRINQQFAKACQILLRCEGRIIVSGMGKSGHIGKKIAATLASTGSPAFFVHPGEASHGDLGMVTHKDAIIVLSNSGETAEILRIVPLIKNLDIPMIAMTGNPHSTLALNADVNIDVTVSKEACPLGLAPTSSTTACLVMGDALAIALLEAKGFTSQDFARSHPGGMLGQRLILRIDDLMRTGDAVPRVTPETTLHDALLEISEKRLGMTAIVAPDETVLGVFTDGDLRRACTNKIDIYHVTMQDVMTRNSKTIPCGMLAAEALRLMEDNKITSLLVVDAAGKLQGVLHMHDVLQKGMT